MKYDRILAQLSDVIIGRSDTIDMDVSLDNGALSDSARRISSSLIVRYTKNYGTAYAKTEFPATQNAECACLYVPGRASLERV